MPGFVDAHVHTFGGTLNDAVRFGVTTVLDQFTDPRLAASKRAARDTLAPGNEADLFSAGMLATAAGGHGTQYGTPVEPVGGPDDAAAWVRARKAEGSDWIKIIHEDGSTFGQDIATLDRDTIGALVACRCLQTQPTFGVHGLGDGDVSCGRPARNLRKGRRGKIRPNQGNVGRDAR